ncbi:MAG: dihydroorotase [Cytophagales bacterium]|nr:dihydroorotase [Cytophagales bacterium]
MANYLIKNASLVNEGVIFASDVLITDSFIEKIDININTSLRVTEIDAEGKYLIPGIIDDQVHFREPGLIHKATIATEAKAAVAGGVTSYMEMPNTKPPATSLALLEQKYEIAKHTSLANYSFYMGTTNTNADEVLSINPKDICGIKIFMGSSTGDMLVENTHALEKIFGNAPCIIAIHSEDDGVVKQHLQQYLEAGTPLNASHHPLIRNVKACYDKTKFAITLAQKYGTKLHVLHISTLDELEFFGNEVALTQKKITAEVCVHHLWYSSDDYATLGNLIKCNPAIKDTKHKEALFTALLHDKLDVIATDHAPHTWDEKCKPYLDAPSGLPLVQHGINIMLQYYHQNKITLPKIVEKMCHNPAILFDIHRRGYLREGYYADMALIDIEHPTKVTKDNIHYKCGWSPLEGHTFRGQVTHTFVSGHLAYENDKFYDDRQGMRLVFER